MFLFHKDFAEKKTKHSSLLFLGRSFFLAPVFPTTFFYFSRSSVILFIVLRDASHSFSRSSFLTFKQIGLLRDFSNRKSTTLRLAIIPLRHIKSMFHLSDKEEAVRVGAKSESQSNNRNFLMPRGPMNVGFIYLWIYFIP